MGINYLYSGKERFKSHYKEEELREGDDHKDFVHAFNAYAPAGTVTGQLVYVNYARYGCLVQPKLFNNIDAD